MKRFTDTEKWRDPWYRELPPRLKCLWQFFCDTCDHSGVFQIDWKLASFEIGEAVSPKDLLFFQSRVQEMPNGRFVIRKFIAFQSGELTEVCPAHKPILKLIAFHGLVKNGIGYQYPSATLSSNTLSLGYDYPSGSLQEKEKEEGKEKDKKEGSMRGDRIPPDPKDVADYGKTIGVLEDDASAFMDFHDSKGWIIGRTRMRDWRAALRTWKRNGKAFKQNGEHHNSPNGAEIVLYNDEYKRILDAMRVIRTQYQDHQTWTQTDLDKYGKLKARKTELKTLLGIVA